MLDAMKVFIAKHEWAFAKTMPQWPHWYVVRKNCNDDEFVTFALYIREKGEIRSWGPYMHTYLDIDGYTYWTIGNPIEETTIINRAEISPN